MKITVLRSILVDGKHVEKGDSVETTDLIGKTLIQSRDAVKFVEPEETPETPETPDETPEEPKKGKGKN